MDPATKELLESILKELKEISHKLTPVFPPTPPQPQPYNPPWKNPWQDQSPPWPQEPRVVD